tara:strand:+ start:4322 stop:4621 length:300 start_codon:yes stop_codon:yes gene_type:complete
VEILNDMNRDFEIIEYLKSGLTIEVLRDLSKKLNLKANEFIRFNDKIFKENPDLKKIANHSELLQLIVKYPKIIQRPIIIINDKAIIARPPEIIREFLL